MLSELEKVFDSAFFNADHNLKLVEQVLQNLDDIVLSEDLGSHLNSAISGINTQIASMAFCFAQLMCRTIVLSENYFILKERFSQVQIENFHLKSDKAFVEFSRKLNKIYTDSFKAKSNKAAPNVSGDNCEVQLGAKSLTESHKNRRMKKRTHRLRTKEPKAVPCKLSFEEDDYNDFEQYFLYSQPTNCLYQNATFRVHRYNNNAFRLLYRNFKEVELINDLRSQNLSLQKEIVMLQTDLSSHQLMVRYLNNQLSGRIQQIQLLTRDKRDSNFERVWSDLESEIQLNKFKTIVRAFHTGPKGSGLINLIQNCSYANVDSAPSALGTKQVSSSVSSDERPLNPLPVETQNVPDVVELHPAEQCNTSPSQPLYYTEELIMSQNFKNFKQSWLSIGLLRFVFVNLSTEALGISILGGKEYGLPIMISEIHPESAADKTGTLRPGDIILTVDFVDATDFTHDEAVNLLKSLFVIRWARWRHYTILVKTGKCRFGVIYFKPEEPGHRGGNDGRVENGCFSNDSSSLVTLCDLPRLSADYYRTVFRATLLSPYGFASCSSDSSDSHDDENESICSGSRAGGSADSGSDRSGNSDKPPLLRHVSGGSATCHSSDDVARRAIPGIASRLFTENTANT